MYESHFRFTGSPFQLNPDPAFYFDSRGHSNALAYLKFGAHQGEGFIVVTGEIGAGKTTLVRTLLAGLNPEQVVAAQVVSTQLESGELLQAILMSFGVASASTSKAHLIGSLEAFLTALAAKGRRALLIIDEAQNLRHEAVEELRMLSNFQLGKHGLLQSFLVGQPELRQLLQSKSMEQLRQRVIASCHLGPLAATETRAYIEHRLRLVGWEARPSFDADAFDLIHRWTGGVPRRINRLCNRLLLGAFLGSAETISSQLVEQTACELRNEIGELSELPEIQAAATAANGPTSARPRALGAGDVNAQAALVPKTTALVPEPALVHPDRVAAAPATERSAAHVRLVPGLPAVDSPRAGEPKPYQAVKGTTAAPAAASTAAEAPAAQRNSPVAPAEAAALQSRIRRCTYRQGHLERPLLCLVETATDLLKAGVLTEAFLAFPSMPKVMAVHVGPESSLLFGDTGADELPMPFVGVHLENLDDGFPRMTSQVLGLFDELLTEFDPSAVLAMGNGDAVLACSLLASKRDVPLLRVAGGMRDRRGERGEEMNGALIDRLSDSLYVNRMDSYFTLYQEGIGSERVLCVGNLVGDMLKRVLPHAPTPSETMTAARLPVAAVEATEGFALVTVQPLSMAAEALAELLSLLCELGGSLPVVWVVNDGGLERLNAAGGVGKLGAARVTLLKAPGYLQLIGLLETAKCLIAGPERSMVEEANLLHIPMVRLSYDSSASALTADAGVAPAEGSSTNPSACIRQILAQSPSEPDSPEYWDSGTAMRIANHLLQRLSSGHAAARSEA